MKAFRKALAGAVVIGCGLVFAGTATATPVTMDFDGIAAGQYVNQYYNGGCSSFLQGGIFLGTSCGDASSNYGVSWTNALVSDLTLSTPPSTPNFMTPLAFGSRSATMNVANGFDVAGFGFSYLGSGNIALYSGLDGTGTLLGSATLDRTSCGHHGFGLCWVTKDFGFSGIAESVVFSRNLLQKGYFDNVTFAMAGSATGVPEPTELGLFGLGALLVGVFAGLRRRLA